MRNMWSSTEDSSEHQSRYLEEHNLVECFFEILPSINREIKHSIIFQMVFKNVYFSLFFFCFLCEKFFFSDVAISEAACSYPILLKREPPHPAKIF